MPLNSSASDVVGTWRVECEGGVETLDLKADGTYRYTVDWPPGKRSWQPGNTVTYAGRWTVEPPSERISGARIRLLQAPETCLEVRYRSPAPRLLDSELAPVWEWGQTQLSFNPDLGGFTRVRAGTR